MKGYTTHHINVPLADSALFKRLKEKTRARSYADTFVQALRALEEKEAQRDAQLKGDR